MNDFKQIQSLRPFCEVTVTDTDNIDNHDNLSRLLDVIVRQTDT